MSAPVLSWLFTVQGTPKHSSHVSPRRTRVHHPPGASSSLGSARPSVQGSLYPTLRANPFPEVTDLFCRLPLSTLFYRPEAANLGDLMRLWVRPGVRISLSFGFSRVVESTPDTSEDKVLYPPFNPISRQSDFRVKGSLKEKTTLPRAPSYVTEFSYVAIQYPRPGWGILTPFPFESRGEAYVCGTSLSLRID